MIDGDIEIRIKRARRAALRGFRNRSSQGELYGRQFDHVPGQISAKRYAFDRGQTGIDVIMKI